MARATFLLVFARRLRQARLISGLAQKAVGVAAGFDEFVASPRINQYDRGVHAPDYRTAQRLAKAMGVTTALLYADDDDVAKCLLALSGVSARETKRLVQGLEVGS